MFTMSDEAWKAEVYYLLLRLLFICKAGKKRGEIGKEHLLPRIPLGVSEFPFTLFLAANIYAFNSLEKLFSREFLVNSFDTKKSLSSVERSLLGLLGFLMWFC